MKSFTHHPVGAPQSLFVSASLHRPNYLTGQPVLFWCTLISGLLLLAIGAHAQPFNQTATAFTSPPNVPVINPLASFNVGQRSVPVFVDIDNDCDKDLFVGNAAGYILYFKNVGTASAPTFVQQTNFANPMNGFNVGSNAKPAFVDIDADGDMDCFVGAGDGKVHAFKNTGTILAPVFVEISGPNTNFFLGNPFDGEDVGANASPAFLDFDNDGDFDCFVSSSSSTNSIHYFRNDRDEASAEFNELTGAANPLNGVNINSNAALTTLNIDGDVDVDIYTGVSDGTFVYFSNNGNGTFSPGNAGPLEDPFADPAIKDLGTGTQYAAPTFVDIDGDGDLDCFSGRNSGGFVYYRNDAPAAPRTMACKPYFVTLSANGQVTIVPNNPAVANALYLSSTFNCFSELSFVVTNSGTLSFTCADATNTTLNPTGTPTASTLTLRATDAAGNTATCSSTVTVLDKTGPVPNTAVLLPVTLDICAVSAFPASYTPTATDVCPTTAVSGVASPSTLPASVGPKTITWTYTDSHGNTSTQTQTFNVVANAPPSFTSSCPTTTVNLTSNSLNPCGYTGTAFTAPIATDCETPITYTSNYTPSSFFPVGPNNVTYAATDASGNTGYCNFIVMVRDSIAPTVTVTSACPTSPVNPVPNDQGVCGAVYTWTAPTYTATDNCGGAVTVTTNFVSGSVLPIGADTIVYKATDISGNTTTFCSFIVRVIDNQSPSITCPVSTTIGTAPGTCVAYVNVVRPSATDNCFAAVVETNGGGMVQATTLPRTQTLPIGPTTFYFRAGDEAAPTPNTATCSYTITVVDNEKPKFVGCPSNVNMAADANGCTKTVAWTTPTVTDNCTPPVGPYSAVISGSWAGTVTVSSFAGDNNTYDFREGISTVTYTVSDGATTPNTAVCSFTVRVTNTIAPTISCPAPAAPVVVSPGANCLYTLTASNLTGITSTATGVCDPGTITYYNSAGAQLNTGSSTLGLGTYTLTARATDASNNSSSCTFSLQVIDQTAPTLVSCPPNITINSAANLCGANPTWAAPVYTDNCSQTITVTRTTTPGLNTPNTAVTTNNNGGFFPVGVTTVNFIAKDAPASPYINISCSIVVTVIDNTKPVITNCPSAQVVVNTSAIGCTASHSLLTPTVTDNCPSTLTTLPAYTVTYTLSGATTATATSYSSTPITLNLGLTTVVYTATDNSPASNSTACTYVIRVADLTPPVINCPANQNIVATSGCSATSATWADATASDNCSMVSSIAGPTFISGPSSVTVSGTSLARFGTFPSGITVLGYTATDNAGNLASCTFQIFVKENVAPVITCPVANITVSTDAATCTRTLTPSLLGTNPVASDNCNLIGVTNSLQSVIPAPVRGPLDAPYVVTFTATDASGNTAACTRSIVVLDQVKPVLICPAQPFTYTIPAGSGNSCVENGNNGSADPNFVTLLPIPTATDNCTATGSLSIIRTPGQPGQYCVNTVNTLQWQTTDGSGNLSTCTQQITIVASCTPTSAPILGCNSGTAVILTDAPGCPASVIVTPASLGLSATDNCGNAITITPSSMTLSATNVAQNITFTATVGQNSTTCVKSITVNRAVEICGNGIDDDCDPATSDVCPTNPPPSFTNCPTAPNVLTVNAANCSATATFTAPATNPVGLAVTTTGATSPFSGTSTITYTASNANGTATCVRTVIVNPAAAEVCGNGIDDDCDGLVDAADPDCGGGNPTACAVVRRAASDGLANDYYGNSVDVDGDLAVVGAYYDDNPGMNSGSAYVLARGAGDTWLQVAKLSPTDGTSSAGDWFGRSVAIDGDYIVVGAPQEAGSGAVYVFHKGATSATWTQVARLVDPTGVAGDQLGYSVAISGDYIIAGAPNDEPTGNPAGNNDGSVSIYQRNLITSTWSLVRKRVATDAMPGDAYGSSVSIDGDYAAVGAPLDDYAGNKTNAGSVYVLENLANAWSEIAHQHASDYLKDDNYGTSVSISGANLLVGAPMNDISAKQNAGSVYILFQDEGGPNAWGETEDLIADDFTAADQFGISVAVDGDVAVIGAHYDDVHGFHSGSAYIFDGSGGWLQVAKLDDVAGDQNDNFGYAVGLSGTTVIVGSWKDDNLGAADQGSVSIFDNCSDFLQSQAENREQEETATPLPAKAGTVLCAPNPATDIINIDVTLPQEEAVRITVCDATGRLLETVFDGKSAAEARFKWDGGRYGRGMYFIRVQSASVSKVVSVTILR